MEAHHPWKLGFRILPPASLTVGTIWNLESGIWSGQPCRPLWTRGWNVESGFYPLRNLNSLGGTSTCDSGKWNMGGAHKLRKECNGSSHTAFGVSLYGSFHPSSSRSELGRLESGKTQSERWTVCSVDGWKLGNLEIARIWACDGE